MAWNFKFTEKIVHPGHRGDQHKQRDRDTGMSMTSNWAKAVGFRPQVTWSDTVHQNSGRADNWGSWNLCVLSHNIGEGWSSQCKNQKPRLEMQCLHVVCLLKMIFTHYSNVMRLGRVVTLPHPVPLKSSLYWFNLNEASFLNIPNAFQLLHWSLLLQLVPKLMECRN